MFPARSYGGKRLAVFGLARSGLACLEALQLGGADAFGWDDREGARAVAAARGLRLCDLSTADFATLDALVLSPGVPLTHPQPHWTVEKAAQAGIPLIGDTEIFAREASAANAVLVAITGTNGKSTTTALLTHVLQAVGMDAVAGGNIGAAVFTLPAPRPGRVYVLELSSYQIDLMPTLRPCVGVLLNLAPDHLDRHGTMENYAAVKARMFARQQTGDTAIVSIDDTWSKAIADRLDGAARKVLISVERVLDSGVSAPERILRDHFQGVSIDLGGMRGLRGRHNWQNACAAYAAARALGVPASDIQAGMRSFPGLAHRMEEVGRSGHVIFVNDSKATNADAAAHALSSFEHIYWIAGGRAKSGGIEDLKPHFARIAHAYLIGEAANDFKESLADHTPCTMCGTVERAVQRAARDAAREQADEAVVLFSPACASFDQYEDFEARGRAFHAAVRALGTVSVAGKEVA